MVQQVCKDIEVELKMSALGRMKRKAPPVLLSIIVSHEANVTDKTLPDYCRLYSWFKLVRHWLQLRFGDTLFMPPRLSTFVNGTLSVKLTLTKTTGPGKKVETLEAHLSPGAWIVEKNWLGEGWDLFKRKGSRDHDLRNYWMPMPSGDLMECLETGLEYVDAAAITRRVLGSLKKIDVLVFNNELIWERAYVRDGTQLHLMEPGLGGFWSEHGDRATFNGWLHELGYSREDRRMAGRWSPESTDEYLSVSRAAVTRMQSEVAAKIRTGALPSDLGESETLDKLKKYMCDRGYSLERAEIQAAKLSFPLTLADGAPPMPGTSSPVVEDEVDEASGDGIAGGAHYWPPESEASSDGFGPPQPEQTEMLEQKGLEEADASLRGYVTPDEEELAVRNIPKGSWVVSRERSGRTKTLHCVGSCWRQPGVHFQWFEELTAAQAEHGLKEKRYGRLCKDCFRDKQAETSSGSESSSSSEES
jgi:hypothetical protein